MTTDGVRRMKMKPAKFVLINDAAIMGLINSVAALESRPGRRCSARQAAMKLIEIGQVAHAAKLTAKDSE